MSEERLSSKDKQLKESLGWLMGQRGQYRDKWQDVPGLDKKLADYAIEQDLIAVGYKGDVRLTRAGVKWLLELAE